MDTLSELLLVGLSHRTAPVAVREQYAVKPEDLEGCLRGLTGSHLSRLHCLPAASSSAILLQYRSPASKR